MVGSRSSHWSRVCFSRPIELPVFGVVELSGVPDSFGELHISIPVDVERTSCRQVTEGEFGTTFR